MGLNVLRALFIVAVAPAVVSELKHFQKSAIHIPIHIALLCRKWSWWYRVMQYRIYHPSVFVGRQREVVGTMCRSQV